MSSRHSLYQSPYHSLYQSLYQYQSLYSQTFDLSEKSRLFSGFNAGSFNDVTGRRCDRTPRLYARPLPRSSLDIVAEPMPGSGSSVALRWLARPLLPGRSAPPARVCLSICIDAITGSRGNSANFVQQVLTRLSGLVHTQQQLSRTVDTQHIQHVVAQRIMISGHQLPSEAGVSIAKIISSRTAWMYVSRVEQQRLGGGVVMDSDDTSGGYNHTAYQSQIV